MTRRQIRLGIAVALTLMAIGSLVWSLRSSLAPGIAERYQGIGQVIAEETERVIGSGKRVVLLTTNLDHAPETRQMVAGFRRAAGRVHLTVLAVEELPGIEPDAVLPAAVSRKCEALLAMLQQYAGADAVVSLAPLPSDCNEKLAGLPASGAKLIVFGVGLEQAQSLCAAHAVTLAFAVRPPAEADSRSARTPRDHFDQFFEIVTASEGTR